MTLKTERLVLCPHGIKYIDSTHKYSSDAENTKYMVHLPKETVEETESFLWGCEREWQKESPSFYEFAILLGEVHIGAVSIYLNEVRDTAELGWILDSAYHNNGYATEAALALMDFAREHLSIHHFVAHCDTENVASQGVMRKIGLIPVSCSTGRRNRNSDKERQEYMYELFD